MAPITEQAVRELAGFKGRSAPVTSCYLDVDGRRYPRRQDYEQELARMLREAKERANGSASLIAADLRRIEDHVKSGFDRSRVRGLALFSCSADDFWEVVALPVPVHNQVVVNHTPHVRQLEGVLAEYERVAVLLADRQRARILVFELGELVERTELFDALPRHDDDGGDWDKDHVKGHADEMAHKHLRRAAQATFELWQDKGFDQLIVGAHDEIERELERELHSYLQERIAGRIRIPVTSPDDDIRKAVEPIVDEIELAREARVVQRMRDAFGAGNGGVAGLKPTLAALVERRVDTLLVSEGYVAEGWRCRSCDWLGAVGRRCPVCDSEMTHVDDIVEEAIEEALHQSCRVEICRASADLDVVGRIGALLRF